MKLAQYIENDKERLLQMLNQADTPDQCRPVLEREIDRLLYAYNEDAVSEQQRKAVSALLETWKLAVPFTDCYETPDIWSKTTPSSGKTSVFSSWNAVKTTSAAVPALAGLICLLLLYASALVSPGALPLVGTALSVARLALAFAGSILLFRAGSQYGRKTLPGSIRQDQLKIIYHTDPEKTYRTLYAMTIAADQHLESLSGASQLPDQKHSLTKNAAEEEQAAAFSLYGDLLEALYSEDGEFALERLEQLRYYLHMQNIEAIDYTNEHIDWFDLMPGSGSLEKTIRPALVRKGILLYKGLAVGGKHL